ncbi:hypothetical protein [Sphingomonas sp. ID1715]
MPARTDLPLTMDSIMHASVLIILHEGHKMLQVHASEAASWKALLGFVEQQWQARFGSLLPPLDETKRIEAFFKDEGDYLIGKVDVSEIRQQIEDQDSNVPDAGEQVRI